MLFSNLKMFKLLWPQLKYIKHKFLPAYFWNDNDHSYLCSQLIMSLLYIDHTTCFGYIAIFRCVTYKNAKNCYYNLTDPLI
jgi:hypothetical protein